MRKIEGLKIRNIAGENLIVRKSVKAVDMTKVVSFNKTAVYIWEAIGNNEFTENDVAQLLVAEFGIDYSQALKDAQIWIDSMIEADLIAI